MKSLKKAARFWQVRVFNMIHTAMKIDENRIHTSVMKTQIGHYLKPVKNGVYVDATLGFGGHTLEILERSNYSAKVICFEIDSDTLAITSDMLSAYKDNLIFIHQNFANLGQVLQDLNIKTVDGIVADLGLSSFLLEQSGRGFSFQNDEFLDMRADTSKELRAFDIINNYSSQQLSELLWKYGEERFSKQIAQAIVKNRAIDKISTTFELRSIVDGAIPAKFKPKKINPSTKVFQALRIAVNNELANLEVFLHQAVSLLAKGGRLAVISFHSLEDRIVKNIFRQYSDPCTCPPDLPHCSCGQVPSLKLITKKAILPSETEVSLNPRSRSARLRVAQKI
ncbi:MAG: 16S rRNA (cytosine(1402)-N(4))-methyltransferase RsmH [Candidatus Dadabacteria bacterium]|nr:16S rRNA (cytosine(1402)-N(4))-methyltransferase RsmH [Candidatus Dadabacteria bacterium]